VPEQTLFRRKVELFFSGTEKEKEIRACIIYNCKSIV